MLNLVLVYINFIYDYVFLSLFAVFEDTNFKILRNIKIQTY